MNLQSHFTLMSDYNQRMNNQFYRIVEELNDFDRTENRGAFFKSIIGTLNHILVGDLIWLTRFSKHSDRYVSLATLSDLPKPNGLDDVIIPDFTLLFETRKKVDFLICKWLKSEVEENDFKMLFEYSNSKGVVSKRDFGELVSHLFNHQTHHRGQLSTLFTQMKLDIGGTDFLSEIPDHQA
ncbi:DinB family protein [Vibrio sp. 10N.261.46.E11]|uniref:DinB family protein n=1 Tax=Vibrio sp. 10N.261.46.E11 TaxID=3229662 RepID=UPI00355109FD